MKLAIIIPNFNHAQYLPMALDAIFSQSHLPDEVIIIDDASTDNSISLIKKMQETRPQIKLLQNQMNQGPACAMNRGIEQSQSEFLIFGSADDFVLPSFFEKAIAFLEKHPSIGLCTGRTCYFEGQTPHLFTPDWMFSEKKPKIIKKDMIPKIFKKTTFFIHSNCTLFRRKHVLEFGGFNPKLHSICDRYLIYQIAFNYGAIYIPSPFGAFRLVETSYSNSLKPSPQSDKIFSTLMELIKKEGKEWENLFKSTGILAHVGFGLVLFLAKHKEYRSFFPRAFIKKCQFHLKKLLKGDDPLRVEDLDSTS